MGKKYRISEFAVLISVSVKTLQRWDKKELLKAFRTPTNRRYYTHNQYLEYIGDSLQEENKGGTSALARGDKMDMTNQYNTPLNRNEEILYKMWVSEQSQLVKRNVADDLVSYDLRGLWRSDPDFDFRTGHAVDTFKKPNHFTFSDESIYHNKDGYRGGKWVSAVGLKWKFYATSTNVLMAGGKDKLIAYFKRYEPDSEVIFSDKEARLSHPRAKEGTQQ